MSVTMDPSRMKLNFPFLPVFLLCDLCRNMITVTVGPLICQSSERMMAAMLRNHMLHNNSARSDRDRGLCIPGARVSCPVQMARVHRLYTTRPQSGADERTVLGQEYSVEIYINIV